MSTDSGEGPSCSLFAYASRIRPRVSVSPSVSALSVTRGAKTERRRSRSYEGEGGWALFLNLGWRREALASSDRAREAFWYAFTSFPLIPDSPLKVPPSRLNDAGGNVPGRGTKRRTRPLPLRLFTRSPILTHRSGRCRMAVWIEGRVRGGGRVRAPARGPADCPRLSLPYV